MPTSTAENYIKTLYLEQQRQDDPKSALTMGTLAKAMGVAPGTATAMIKTLAGKGMVDYRPREAVHLTQQGQQVAFQILRRHRLIELFLVQVLNLDWTEVHEEAEVLEHAISDKVLEKIDALLDHPQTDPHGDPIPPANGPPKHSVLKSLADPSSHDQLIICRILDQNQPFLTFLHEHGLLPNTVIQVIERHPIADAITIQPQGQPTLTLGRAAASKILVQKV